MFGQVAGLAYYPANFVLILQNHVERRTCIGLRAMGVAASWVWCPLLAAAESAPTFAAPTPPALEPTTTRRSKRVSWWRRPLSGSWCLNLGPISSTKPAVSCPPKLIFKTNFPQLYCYFSEIYPLDEGRKNMLRTQTIRKPKLLFEFCSKFSPSRLTAFSSTQPPALPSMPPRPPGPPPAPCPTGSSTAPTSGLRPGPCRPRKPASPAAKTTQTAWQPFTTPPEAPANEWARSTSSIKWGPGLRGKRRFSDSAVRNRWLLYINHARRTLSRL